MLNNYEEKMAETASKVLGGEQKGFTYWNKSKTTSLNVLFSKNSPGKGLLTCSTVGLVNSNCGFSYQEKEIRNEIVMGSYGGDDLIGRIICTAAFGVMLNNYNFGYGTVFAEILPGYLPESDMRHLLFIIPPPIWKNAFEVIEMDEKLFTWLFALPISEAERLFLEENDIDALQSLFTDKKVDIFDLNRKSAV